MSDPFASHLNDLTSADVVVRKSAINALAKSGDPRAAPALIQLLDDPIVPTRCQAAQALAKLRDLAAIDPLIRKLQTDVPLVRRKAVAALTRFSDPRINPALIQALADPDAWVNEVAALALGKRGERRAVPALIALLDDPNRKPAGAHWTMVRAFGSSRGAAITALGQFGDPQAIPTLVRAMEDDNSEVQRVLPFALKGFGAAILPLLLDALKSNNETMRFSAFEMLLERNSKPPVPLIIPLLKDSKERARRNAANYLGQCGDPLAIPALVETIELTGESGSVALLKFGTDGKEALLSVLRCPPGEHYLTLLKSLESPAGRHDLFVPLLLELLRSNEATFRAQAAKLLGAYSDERAVPALMAAALDSDGKVREAAVRSLGTRGDDRAIDLLRAALQDDYHGVRYNAIGAIGTFGVDVALEPLIGVLRFTRSAYEREAAADLLVMFRDPRGMDVLFTIADSPDDAIANTVALKLRKSGDRRAVIPLIRVLGSEYRFQRDQAAEALGDLGETTAVDAIIQAMERDPEYSTALVKVLGRLGDPRAIAPLRRRLEQSRPGYDEPYALIGALQQLNAIPVLVEALRHPDDRVRRNAAEAFEKPLELGEWRTAAIAGLQQASQDRESTVRSVAKKALRRLGASVL